MGKMDLNTTIKHPWFVDGFDTTSVIANEGTEIYPQWKHVCSCNYGYAEPLRFLDENKINAKRIAQVPTMIYLLKKTAITLEIMHGYPFIETPELLHEIERCLIELGEL